MENIIEFEKKLNFSSNLIELAKAYCEYNIDNSKNIPALISALDAIQKTNKELFGLLDKFFYNAL